MINSFKKPVIAFCAFLGVWSAAFGAGLPSDYTELEYIEADGTQYLLTGLKTTASSRYEYKFGTVDSVAGVNVLIGGELRSDGALYGSASLYYLNASGRWFAYIGGPDKITNWVSNAFFTYSVGGGTRSLTHESSGIVSSLSRAVVQGKSLTLMGNPNGANLAKGRVRSFKFWEGEALVGYMIPCVRDVDGTAGLYDLVRKDFYVSATASDFVAGPLRGNVVYLSSSCEEVGEMALSLNGAAIESGYGRYEFGAGGDLVVTQSEVVEEDNVKWSLLGWRLTKKSSAGVVSTLESDESNKARCVFSFADGDVASLEWLWKKEFYVALSGEDGVEVSSPGAWCEVGSIFTAEVSSGDFLYWATDDGEVVSKDAVYSFVVNEPLSLRAMGASKILYLSPDGTGDGSSASSPTNLPIAEIKAKEREIYVLLPGRYSQTANVTLSTDAIVRGATGNFDDVILDRGSGQAWTLTHKDAVLEGITVLNGNGGSYNANNKTGGAVCNFGGTVRNCHITRSTFVETKGCGGVRNVGGRVENCVIDGFEIYDSYADSNGNAPALWQSGADAVTTGCVITNNVQKNLISRENMTGAFSSAVLIKGGLFEKSVVVNNTGYIAFDNYACGGAVLVNGGVVEGCTVVNNHYRGAWQRNGAAIATVGSSSVVKNCFAADNGHRAVGTKPQNFSGDGTFENNSEDASAYVIGEDGLPRLRAGSSLIGKGIGALEYDAGDLDCYFRDDLVCEPENVSGTLTAVVAGALAEDATVAWDLDGDGEYDDATGSTIEFSRSAVGTITVSCKAMSGDISATFSRKVEVAPKTVYVVSGSKVGASPYGSWGTAAATLKDALAVAGDGTTIILSNGTYKADTTYTITKAVAIKGLTGDWKDVIINANGKYILFAIANTKASLENVTITNAKSARWAAAVELEQGGVLKNCRITGCEITNSGTNRNTGYPALTSSCSVGNRNGAIIDCVVDGNNSQDGYNKTDTYNVPGIYQEGENAITERCIITNNIAGKSKVEGSCYDCAGGIFIAGGVVRSSYIAGNILNHVGSGNLNGRVYNFAGGAYLKDGVLINCTVVNNEAVAVKGNNTFNIYEVYVKKGSVVNSYITGGTNRIDSTYLTSGAASGAYTNSCVYGATELTGSGNFEAGRDYLKLYCIKKGKLDLGVDSPLYGKGVNEDWMKTALDINGNRRLFGSKVDIGAVESQKQTGLAVILR